MTVTRITTMDEATIEIAHSQSPTGRMVRRLLHKRLALVCLFVIATFYFFGTFAPIVAPYGYSEQNLDRSFEGPSWRHPFGNDRNGRDTLSRNIYAARTTVIVTIATILAGGFVLPVTLGMLAGYRGGAADWLINRIGEILASLPGLPMLVLINATLRPKFNGFIERWDNVPMLGSLVASGFSDYFLIFSVLSFFGWVGGARLIRSQVLTMRRSEFILAAEASGATTWRVIFRHILPNLMPLIIVSLSASMGAIAGSEIALTFLGVGIQPPRPSFGALISDGASRTVLENHPELLLVPAIVVASLIFAFNLLGDALTDIVTPKSR